MPNTITNRQMVFVLMTTITTMSMLSVAKTMAVSAGSGAWIAFIITALIFAVMAVVICELNKMYKGKVFFDYSREIVGKTFSYVVGVFYIIFFLIFSTYLCTDFTIVLHTIYLLKTPEWALILAGMPLYGFIAYKGITNMARLSEIIGFIFFLVVSIGLVTMFFAGNINNLLPLFNPSKMGTYMLSIKEAIEPFLGISVLFIIPFTVKNKRASKTAFFTLMCIGFYYILDVYGCFAMIGLDEIKYHSYPLIDAIRLVEYPKIEFLQRVDIIYVTLGFMRVIIGKSIVYLVIVEYLCKLFSKFRRIVIVFCAGIAIFISSTIVIGMPEGREILVRVLMYTGIIAEFLIPLVLFIIAKVKKNAEKNL